MMLRVVDECEVRVMFLSVEPEIVIALRPSRLYSDYSPMERRQAYQNFYREVVRVGLLIEKLGQIIDPRAIVSVDYPRKEELLGTRLYDYDSFSKEIAEEDNHKLLDFVPDSVHQKVDSFLNLVLPPQNYLLGMCHTIWSLKKCILRDGFDRDWQTPSERNPHVLFD